MDTDTPEVRTDDGLRKSVVDAAAFVAAVCDLVETNNEAAKVEIKLTESWFGDIALNVSAVCLEFGPEFEPVAREFGGLAEYGEAPAEVGDANVGDDDREYTTEELMLIARALVSTTAHVQGIAKDLSVIRRVTESRTGG